MVLPEAFRVCDERASFKFDKIEIALMDSLTVNGGRLRIARKGDVIMGNYEDERYAILSIEGDHHSVLMALFLKYVQLKVKENKAS